MTLAVVPESLYDIAAVEDPQISPDGRTIAFVRMQPRANANAYRRAIWLVPADGGAPARPLTAGSAQDFAPRWAPDGRTLAFVSTRSGAAQLYLLPLDGGEPRQLTTLDGGVSHPEWSPDGQWIAFNAGTTAEERRLEESGVLLDPALAAEVGAWRAAHREQLRDPRVITKLPYRTGTSFFDGRYQHVYVVAAAGGAPRRLSDGDYHHSAPSWAADSRSVVANSNRDQSSGDEFFELWSTIVRLPLGGAEQVVAHEVSEQGRPAHVSPDGQWVAYIYLPKVESPYAAQYHVAVSPIGGGERRLITADAELTVTDFAWDADSAHLLLTIHDHGDSKLARVGLNGGDPEILLDGPRWVGAFSSSRDGQRIACAISAPTDPGELYVLDRATGAERRLTEINAAWRAAHTLSAPEEIRYRGADDVEVQGWFMRPTNFDPGQRYPLAVEIHGGPQIMWGNSFWHEFQTLAAHGYYVFYCNPRGSAGYGARFQLIRGKGGYTDMPDIMAGLDEVLAREPAADPERLAVTGGSYGGFLTGWIVGHTDRFKAAVAQRGVYDQLNMFGSGDIPESVEWYHGGIPRPETLAELWEYSPAAYAAKVTTPLLIKHADLDFRVPVSQAETFFAALRRHGNRDAVLLRYPREGHELSRAGEPAHRVDRLHRILAWFDHYIQHERGTPRRLTAADVATLSGELGGWRHTDGALHRDVDCGTMAIALEVAARVGAVATQLGCIPRITVEGPRLELRIGGADGVTEHDLLLARTLDARTLPTAQPAHRS